VGHRLTRCERTERAGCARRSNVNDSVTNRKFDKSIRCARSLVRRDFAAAPAVMWPASSHCGGLADVGKGRQLRWRQAGWGGGAGVWSRGRSDLRAAGRHGGYEFTTMEDAAPRAIFSCPRPACRGDHIQNIESDEAPGDCRQYRPLDSESQVNSMLTLKWLKLKPAGGRDEFPTARAYDLRRDGWWNLAHCHWDIRVRDVFFVH